MKHTTFALLALTCVGSIWGIHSARAETIEVPVDAVLAPSVGYDDNDKIQIVIHGALPNRCYTLGKTEAKRMDGTKRFRIFQYAERKTDEICAQSELPPHLMAVVPFTEELSVGQLPVGDYEFDFVSRQNRTGLIALNVGQAQQKSIDEVPYASVSVVDTADVVSRKESVEVTIKGVLTSSCFELPDQIESKIVGNVAIVLPKVKVLEGMMCIQSLQNFTRKVQLGALSPGHHLVHVRSMNGQAKNKVFEVLE